MSKTKSLGLTAAVTFFPVNPGEGNRWLGVQITFADLANGEVVATGKLVSDLAGISTLLPLW